MKKLDQRVREYHDLFTLNPQFRTENPLGFFCDEVHSDSSCKLEQEEIFVKLLVTGRISNYSNSSPIWYKILEHQLDMNHHNKVKYCTNATLQLCFRRLGSSN